MRTYTKEEKQAVIDRVIFGEPSAHIIRRSRHHWRSQYHLPKANIIRKKHLLKQVLFSLAGAEGLEPTTHGFGDQYSTN